MTDELKRRRGASAGRRETRSFADLLAEGVKWPFQAAFEFPAALPEMPKMVPSRRPRGDLVFESKKMLRTVRCESKNERLFFEALDARPEVLWFHEQAERVPYVMHGRSRSYAPDATVALRNGHIFVAEVKLRHDLGLFETICKVNALTEWAQRKGRGVFLGNATACVGDVLKQEVSQLLRRAVLTAVDGRAGMSRDQWKRIRRCLRETRASLQPIIFEERLVMTLEPFNVRRSTPEEEKRIDTFVGRFGSVAPVLALSAPAAPRRPATATTGTDA